MYTMCIQSNKIMKIFANIREFYFGGGYYPFFFVGDEINIALMIAGGETNKITNQKDNFLTHLYLNEYEFIGTIKDCYERGSNRNVFIIEINFFYIYFFSDDKYTVGDRIGGIITIAVDPGGFISTEEELNFLYNNFKILTIKKIVSSIRFGRSGTFFSELLEEKKISIEEVNNTMGEDFIHYILELDSDGIEEKIICRTITD